jgi:hypothetical protein
MRKGQVSKTFFCSWCATPAVVRRASRLTEPWRGYWATPCPCAAKVVRMGPRTRAAVLAAHEARQARERTSQRRAIADCLTGEPIVDAGMVGDATSA